MAPFSQSKDYSTFALLKDLYSYLKPFRARIAVATVMRIIGDLAWLYPPYALALIINFLNAYTPGDSLHAAWVIFGLALASVAVRYLCLYIAKVVMYRTSEQLSLDLQLASIGHLFRLDIGWHEKENTGNKLKRITRGGDSANRVLRIWIDNVLEIAINFVGITFVIARFDTSIALLTCAFLVTYYILAFSLRKRAANAAIIFNIKEEEVQGVLFESLNNIRTVKVLGMASALSRILSREMRDLLGKVYTRVFWFQSGNSIRNFYAYIFQIGAMAFVVYSIIHGQYEVGFLVLFYGYFMRLLQSVGELANITQEYVIAKLSVGRMFEILREPVGIDQEEGKRGFPANWKDISLRHISFAYGENPVLDGISLDIQRGEKIGIVGLSGAGKSTLFKLLLKEHENYSGEILIDTVPLSDISRQDYFKYSAVVLQDTEVFNFSLRENIILANQDRADDTELFEKALRVAHVEDFLSRLPEGVDTLIGEKGVRLSGGERQRLGIARAVFKSPQLLLLDEATSHLDIESEEKIQASLHEFFQNVTAVVIAHRLTTIKEMDRIVVLEGGKILEVGSFDELYAKKGRFYDLWEKQSL